MRFIFVRHGKTHFNEINLTQGWCDSPLSKVGIRQVEGISTELVRKLNIESPNWLENLDMDYRPYEGEDIHDVILKHHEALQEIIENCNDNETVLIVGHGCSLYGLLKSLFFKEQFLEFPNNATAIIVDYSNGNFKLEQILDPII